MLAAAGVTVAVALCAFLIGALVGALGAWAKLSGGMAARLAADAYTTVLRGIPDLLVIYLFYFGGSAALTPGRRLVRAERVHLGPRPSRRARWRSALSPAPTRPRSSAAPTLRSPAAKSRPRARSGMHALAAVPAHRGAAGAALRPARARQRLAAGAQGIGADLGHGPRRAPAPVADRRRFDAPALRLLCHRRRALSRDHHRLGLGLPTGGGVRHTRASRRA